jgi:hypothetical protein
MSMIFVSIQRVSAIFGILLLGTAATTAFGQAPAAETSINLTMRQRDGRVQTPVSFSADRMYLGDLLKTLSQKTVVSLAMDAADPYSGVEITFDLKGTPLADVMNALPALVGTKKAGWEWSVDTTKTPTLYTLRTTPAVRTEPDRLARMRQETFERLSDLIILMASMPPEEREVNRQKLHSGMIIENRVETDPARAVLAAKNNFWGGIQLYGDVLSAEQRARVLHLEPKSHP